MDDEHLTDDESEVDEPRAPAGDEAPPSAPPAEIPSFEGLSSGKEPWKGGGCSSRLPLYGCVIGLALVIAFLMAGTSMVRRTVWSNFENARGAIWHTLPPELPEQEAARTRRNLENFRAVLERTDDPYPLMGEFVGRAREIQRDGRVTVEEVDALNLVLERWIEESGIPVIQLGEIRNSEFGFRKRRPSGRWRDSQAEILKFEIRNSKFHPA
jgi:hypothetical protein